LHTSSKQVGWKYGEHKLDYPELNSYLEYVDKIYNVFENPDMIILDEVNSEYYYIQGEDLLRITTNGDFVSLYPGAGSNRVTNALDTGGLIWEK